MNDSLRKLVTAAALGALSVVLILTPFGMIPWFSGASLTTMHVPAIIGAVIEGPAVGMITGAVFGIASLVRAAIAPTGPLDPFFSNPLVSILPRLVFPILAWLIYRAFRGRFTAAAAAAAGVAGSLAHSFLVLGLLMLVGAIPPAVAAAVFVGNSTIEAAAAALLCAAVVTAWKGIAVGKGRARLADEEGDDAPRP